MLMPAFAVASEWQYLNGNESKYLEMDFSSISSGGQYKKAWAGTVYLTPQNANVYPARTYSSDRTLYYFDCLGQRLQTVQYIQYENMFGEGEVISSSSVKFNPQNLTDVVPDSVGEALLKLACGPASDREKIRARNKASSEHTAKLLEELKQSQSKK